MKKSKKLYIVLGFILVNAIATQGQTTLKFRQEQFARLVILSDNARDLGYYDIAFKKLYAAAEVCPECSDSSKIEFQELFDVINAANKKLTDTNKKLETERKKAKEAEKKAKKAEEEAREALAEALKQKGKSDGLARAGENASTFMQALDNRPTLAIGMMLYNAKHHPESKISSDILIKTVSNTKIGFVKKTKTIKDKILSVAYSPDGEKIVVGCTDNTAVVWNKITGDTVILKGHSGNINAVEFSPDGKYILTGSADGTARLWDTTRKISTKIFNGHGCSVTSVAFSPNGKYILTGSSDSTAKLWNIETESVLNTFTGHCDFVTSVAFSPDGKKVITGSLDKSITISDIETIINPQKKKKEVIIAAKGMNQTKTLIDVEKEERVKIVETTFDNQMAGITSVAFSPDGTKIATACTDNTARILDIRTGQFKTYFEHTEAVNTIAFSKNGNSILTGSKDNKAILWDVESAKVLKEFEDHNASVTAVAFSPNHSEIVTVGEDKKILTWHLKKDESLYKNPEEIIFFIDKIKPEEVILKNKLVKAISNDCSKIMYLDESDFSSFRIKDSLNNSWSKKYVGHTQGKNILASAFSLTGDTLITSSQDKTFKLWDLKTNEIIANFVDTVKNDTITRVYISVDGEYIKAHYKKGKDVILERKTDCIECKFKQYSLSDLKDGGLILEKEDSVDFAKEINTSFIAEEKKIESYNPENEKIEKLDTATRKLIAISYGNMSWYSLIANKMDSAIEQAKRGLVYDSSRNYIRMNLAHALLFQGKVEQAQKIYTEYIEKYEIYERHDIGVDSLVNPEDLIMIDFGDLERSNHIPEKNAEDVEKIKVWLRKRSINKF